MSDYGSFAREVKIALCLTGRKEKISGKFADGISSITVVHWSATSKP